MDVFLLRLARNDRQQSGCRDREHGHGARRGRHTTEVMNLNAVRGRNALRRRPALL